MEGLIVANKFLLSRKLGAGAFGEIWQSTNTLTGEEAALKFEDVTARHQQLYAECKIYLWFHSELSAMNQAIPQVYYYGVEGKNNIMVMDLLGSSLEDNFNNSGKKLSMKTVLMVADQMIKRMEYIHSRKIIHRDIKPDNFSVGYGKNKHRIYVFDFGLAKKYMNSDGSHIKYREGKSLTGTARYASINTHLGIEQSRRDDIEALAYVFIYMVKGVQPWMNLKSKNVKEKYDKIKDVKVETKVEDQCRGLPKEFAIYTNYCRDLGFEEKPDYPYMRAVLMSLFKSYGYTYDYMYDWVIKEDK